MTFTGFICFGSEICLYMSTLGFIVSLFGNTLPSWCYLSALLISEALCSIMSHTNGILRYLPLLLCAPLFIFASSPAAVIFPIPVCVLIFLRARSRGWSAEYDTYRSTFKVGIGIYIPVIIIALFNDRIDALLKHSLPLYIIWLLLAVISLRFLRSDRSGIRGGKFRILNILLVVIIAAVGFLISSDACVSAVIFVLKSLYDYVIAPLVYVVLIAAVTIPTLIIYLIMSLISHLSFGENNVEADADAGLSDIFPQLEEVTVITPAWLKSVAISLMIIAFLTVCFFICRKLISKKRTNTFDTTYSQRSAYVQPQANKKPGIQILSNSPAGIIRNCYKRYLEVCRRLNIPVDGSIASDVIYERSKMITGDVPSSELRELWLRARFSGNKLDDADARSAKTALKTIRSTAGKTKPI